jgi:rare lipoprotein A
MTNKMMPAHYALLLMLSMALLLSACSTSRAPGRTTQGTYKVGTPYKIDGVWYYPHEDFSYDETGIASWYGAAFHGGATANGEIYNKDELTAAHRTLPLPTLARVTNLENGRSIVVRINDRGPYAHGRIIDMSQRAAQLLGFEQKGTAEVRVQVLSDESKAIADAERQYGHAESSQTASVAPVESVAVAEPQVKNLEPVQTTPEVHQQLLTTKPVQAVVQVPVSGQHRIFVQAGAFTVPENAEKMKARFSKLGNVSISDVVVNGTTYHRVRVGPLNDVPQADAMIKRLMQAGVTNARTVVD